MGGIELPILEPAFVLSCNTCDAGDGVHSLAQALAEGWHGIEYDDGPSWNFLGWCPQCAEASCKRTGQPPC